ncbi:MAG: DNA polymerase IV [Verrucomicrobiales bacterium]
MSERPRSIVHLDADAFFASVEQASDPRLRGRPVAVGGESRGIVASASYEARKYGIYTPMPTVRARKLCPRLVVVPGDFEKYERFSRWMFGYAYEFTPDVEQASIDEGYFDLSGCRRPAVEVAETIRRAIGQSLRISVSEGIGSNKFVSAVASKLRKPAALVEVPRGGETAFLHPLAAKWLPGVGPHTAGRLQAAGLARIGQVAATPVELLELVLGRMAPTVRQLARGIDDRPVVAVAGPAKSYGQQETFAQDVTDEEWVGAVLRRMADDLMAKVREEGKAVRTVTVKVRYNDMDEDQRSETLPEPTDLETDVYGRLPAMLRHAWKRRVSLRLVALRLSNVYDEWWRLELPLGEPAQRHDQHRRLARALDDLRRTHGRHVILRGHDMRLREDPVPEADRRPPSSARESTAPRAQIGRPSTTAQLPALPLNVRSVYSFLDSTLTPEAIVGLAAQHGLPAVALTDTGNLHGVVAFAQAARQAGVKPLIGAEVRVEGHPLLLYVENSRGYNHLCQLLSRLNESGDAAARGEGEGEGEEEGAGVGGEGEGGGRSGGRAPSVAARQYRSLTRDEVGARAGGLVAVGADASLAPLFPGAFYQAVTRRAEADGLRYPGVFAPRVHYATPADRIGYDIVQSIRTRTLLRQPHPEKRVGGACHFRPPGSEPGWCRDHPGLLARTHEVAARCTFEFPFGPPQFPEYVPSDGASPRDFLRRLVFDGLHERYGARAGSLRPQIEEELGIIAAVGYEGYFLLVWDLLQDCRRQGIEWITRGSAADSLVCYCLRISDVCPVRFDLYFRRFLNRERMALNKLPDIDIDFPHDRKDDVVNLVLARHGAAHGAVVGGFSTFKARSAFAEVAKVLGMADREVRRITAHFPWGFGGGWVPDEPAPTGGARFVERLKSRPECADLPLDEEPCRTALEMAARLDGLPRHPKMHPCGVVLSRQPLQEITPTFTAAKGWPATHLDMEAVEAAGLVKLDILAQGGLAAMRDARQALAARGVAIDLAALEPWEDPAVWEMIAGGGARAVHHIESPAMVSLCRQTNVREIDGLVAIVSVIRPGAANEHKKLRFTRRYQGLEPVTYPHPSLERCLRSTFGLVVYEEHILQICEDFAGLSPGRADVLRRALVKQKRSVVDEVSQEFAAAAAARGHPPEKTAEVWDLVTGFSGYAFCRAHSTAYGVEAYQAAWLKHYHPAEFMAAVLTNGKGFYDPLVYVLECHRLGLRFLPPCLNHPGPAFNTHQEPRTTNEEPRTKNQERPPPAIRVPALRTKGLTARTTAAWQRALASGGPFASLADFFHRVGPLAAEMEALIRVGAFDGFGAPRTAQFWEAQFLLRTFGGAEARATGQGWLIPPPGLERLPDVPRDEPTTHQRLVWETDLLGFAVSGHPLSLFPHIAWDSYCPVVRLGDFPGQTITTCGLVVEQRTHHQITGEPMKFLTLADWTGLIETELFADTYRRHGLATVRHPVLEITATVEPFDNGHGHTLRVLRAGPPRETAG